jgi:hypothetical protein
MRRTVIYGLIGFLCFSLTMVHGYIGFRAEAEQNWRPLSQAPPALVEQFKYDIDFATNNQKLDGVEVLEIDQKPAKKLFLVVAFPKGTFVPGKPSLCGNIACDLKAYVSEELGGYRLVANGVFRPLLPRGVTFIEPTNQVVNRLPCLVINQEEGKQLTTRTLCFDGSRYKQTGKTTTTPLPKAQTKGAGQ